MAPPDSSKTSPASAKRSGETQAAGRKGGGRRNLVGMVSEDLRRSILAGEIETGGKLPSEAELTRKYQVSRTVIREAVASLRSDGLVEARHGVGVFVLSNQPTIVLPFQSLETSRISSIIEMLELRAAVEIEGAALAAVRRSPAQEEAIFERYDDINKLIAQGRRTTEADFSFHLAIADATNNPRFREFLEVMGKAVIPRGTLQNSSGEKTPSKYLEQLQAEHRRIAEAISARDESAAREAVRTHLMGSQERYRRLIRKN